MMGGFMELWGIIGILVLIIVAMGYFWIKSSQKKNQKIRDAETRAGAAEGKLEKLQENIEQVLDYEKHDAFLVKQRDQHIEKLIKTKSKGVANEEVKNLMVDLRDAYNSL